MKTQNPNIYRRQTRPILDSHVSQGFSSSDKVALLLPKLLYIICKCNHTAWPHVSLCRSGKQPSCKMGLLHIISPSAALLRDSKWVLVLPWQCRGWLRYEATTFMRPESFLGGGGPSAAVRSFPIKKQTNKILPSVQWVWFVQPHLDSSLDFMIICPGAGDFITFLFISQQK